MIGIYKITNPKGKVYIGQSNNVYKRIQGYKRNPRKGRTLLYYSLKKYGPENHIFEIIQECELNELNEKERYYQELYNCLDKRCGLNLLYTKTDTAKLILSESSRKKISESLKLRAKIIGYRPTSEETKKKIGIANKGRRHSEETKSKLSKAGLGRKLTEEHIKKISEKNTGKVRTSAMRLNYSISKIGNKSRTGMAHSIETKLKMSLTKKGKKFTKEHVKKLSEKKKKIILCKETGIFYFGIQEVSMALNISPRTVSRIINGHKMRKANFKICAV